MMISSAFAAHPIGSSALVLILSALADDAFLDSSSDRADRMSTSPHVLIIRTCSHDEKTWIYQKRRTYMKRDVDIPKET